MDLYKTDKKRINNKPSSGKSTMQENLNLKYKKVNSTNK